MTNHRDVDKKHCTSTLRGDYAHVGLFDVDTRACWIARKRWGIVPVRVSHARLLKGGTQDTSTSEKDRFVCYWYHTPGTGQGYVHGYPIDWSEGHLLVRLDPQWNYRNRELIPSSDTARIEKNIDQQYEWGSRIFERYRLLGLTFPLSWHMIGPRPTDSMFYIQRVEPESG